MITLQTITTIELSSACNLSCKYCINRLMRKAGREPGIMTEEVFEASLGVLKCLVLQNTQREVNMNGNGESFLDPDLPSRIRLVKLIMGDRQVGMCTNGVDITEEKVKAVLDAGLDRLDLSPHSPFHVRKAVVIFQKLGVKGILNTGTLLASHNWAGQLEEFNSIDMTFTIPCDPLIEGRGYIQSHGGVSPCCYDFRGLGQFGTVFDADIFKRPILPYELCAKCHQKMVGVNT